MVLAKSEQDPQVPYTLDLLSLRSLMTLHSHGKTHFKTDRQTDKKGHKNLLEYLNGHNHSLLQSYACVRLII